MRGILCVVLWCVTHEGRVFYTIKTHDVLTFRVEFKLYFSMVSYSRSGDFEV